MSFRALVTLFYGGLAQRCLQETHTQLEKSTDFPWASQAQSCCCGFSLQNCQSRSDFPDSPTLPVARTRSMSCLLLIWSMQRPRAPQGQSTSHPGSPRIAAAADERKLAGHAPQEWSGDQSKYSLQVGTLPRGQSSLSATNSLVPPMQLGRVLGPW